jgi:hypothetical protein
VKDELEIEAKVSSHGLMEGTCGQENWTFFHENLSSFRDLNPGPQEYEAGVLQLNCDISL